MVTRGTTSLAASASLHAALLVLLIGCGEVTDPGAGDGGSEDAQTNRTDGSGGDLDGGADPDGGAGGGDAAPDAALDGTALSFDGTDDVVSIAFGSALEPRNAVTVEAWINLEDSTAGQIAGIWEPPDTKRWLLEVAGGKLVGWISIFDQGDFSIEADVPTGEWTHVAFTWNDSDFKAALYINGSEAASTFFQGSMADLDAPLVLGQRQQESASPGYLHGRVDEVRVWTTARTAGEVLGDMESEIDPSTEGLAAYYRLDAPAGDQVVRDATANSLNGTLGADATASDDDPLRIAEGAPITELP